MLSVICKDLKHTALATKTQQKEDSDKLMFTVVSAQDADGSPTDRASNLRLHMKMHISNHQQS